ncbi:hypothetical protein BCV70DRAFT_91629 [Testicularia cyperi]|uniref:Uncharacterized protein n=1 Tax=Testicularia cyperi TaxID=1882483 RepID=A0A317XSM9_9BASI|nr:hypothetical protein BCV70DRAFT_91629 [Testicularia cyperi]
MAETACYLSMVAWSRPVQSLALGTRRSWDETRCAVKVIRVVTESASLRRFGTRKALERMRSRSRQQGVVEKSVGCSAGTEYVELIQAFDEARPPFLRVCGLQAYECTSV